jgi:molecular chaperone DnaK (HSP70)
MSVIIPRNSPIPCVKTQTYTTEENYQTEIDVCVYEGERSRTDQNNLLGKFSISGIEKAKRGVPKIDVSFSLDSNGMLAVTAKDQTTGAEAHIQIQRSGRSSEAEVERMVRHPHTHIHACRLHSTTIAHAPPPDLALDAARSLTDDEEDADACNVVFWLCLRP